jgi:hypothetical protein
MNAKRHGKRQKMNAEAAEAAKEEMPGKGKQGRSHESHE